MSHLVRRWVLELRRRQMPPSATRLWERLDVDVGRCMSDRQACAGTRKPQNPYAQSSLKPMHVVREEDLAEPSGRAPW